MLLQLGPLIAYLPINHCAPLSIIHFPLQFITASGHLQGSLVAMTLTQGDNCRRLCSVAQYGSSSGRFPIKVGERYITPERSHLRVLVITIIRQLSRTSSRNPLNAPVSPSSSALLQETESVRERLMLTTKGNLPKRPKPLGLYIHVEFYKFILHFPATAFPSKEMDI